MRIRILSLAVALMTACSNPPATGSVGAPPDVSTDARSAALGDTLEIVLGRSVSVDRSRLVLTFRSHGADSRCPANVTCVWMGDVPVRIAARSGATSADVELHTGIEPRTLTVGPYIVKLVGMLPYPGTTPEGQQTTPTAVLVVARQ